MTRSYSFAVAIAAILGFTAHLQAEEIIPKQTDPTPATEKVARADDSMEKMDKAMEKDAPVSLIKSEYNDSNVAWMNRDGFVVGAPAWKGGEDGLHCH